jgi:hypothetical protein
VDIVFMDATAWPYDPDTPFQRPLGGSQSAACYLAPELVKLGHRVTLANRADEPSWYVAFAANRSAAWKTASFGTPTASCI